MKIVKTTKEMRDIVKEWKKEGFSVGLVPTMGFLHEGHESLIVKSVGQNEKTVVSVFVNPTQFAPNEDYDAYPRDIYRDADICENAGADVVFNPEPEEMYKKNHTFVNIDTLSEGLCGKTRPTHFRGVCTVVSKLFNIVDPDRAYFGQKDAQQLAIIKKMAADLNFDIEIIGCPIVREEDGLAKSSRNTYLSDEERKAALCLSKGIFAGKALYERGERNVDAIKAAIVSEIEKEPLAKIDYVEIVDLNELQKAENANEPILAAIAVYIGKTRLIDNFMTE